MMSRQREIGEAAISLVKNLPPGSEVMVNFFADKPSIALPFTPASAIDLHSLEDLKFGHRTALFDSIAVTEQYFVHFAHYPRRALVLITDGNKNASAMAIAAHYARC